MPVSEISICNSALIKIGADVISALSQDTKSARCLNAVFDQVRDEVLRSHPWNFAITRSSLTPTANTPVYEYDYEYSLPSDCLRVLGFDVDDDYETPEYVIEDGKILSNYSEMKLRYVYRNEDPSSWDPMFAEALAWRLAQQVAYALTQSASVVAYAAAGYERALAFARSTDGSEGTLKGLIADSWTTSRRR